MVERRMKGWPEQSVDTNTSGALPVNWVETTPTTNGGWPATSKATSTGEGPRMLTPARLHGFRRGPAATPSTLPTFFPVASTTVRWLRFFKLCARLRAGMNACSTVLSVRNTLTHTACVTLSLIGPLLSRWRGGCGFFLLPRRGITRSQVSIDPARTTGSGKSIFAPWNRPQLSAAGVEEG